MNNRRPKTFSEAYNAPEWNESNDNNSECMSQNDYIRKKKTRSLPKQWPEKVIYVMAKLTGIKTHINDRPIISTIIKSMLLFGALSYVACRFWYLYVDIQNPLTPSTFFTEIFSVMITLIWSSVGVYSHRMLFYIFSSPSLLDHVRQHSRSFLKFNTKLLTLIWIVVFCALNIRQSLLDGKTMNCKINNLPEWFCQLRLVTVVFYSVPAIFFNAMVFFVLLSVMRTHVIVLRRQICDLERDENVLKRIMKIKQQHKIFTLPDIDIQMTMDSDDEPMSVMEHHVNSTEAEEEESNTRHTQHHQLSNISRELESNELPQTTTTATSTMNNDFKSYSVAKQMHELDARRASASDYEKLLMPSEEINYRYRTLYHHANTISQFFQRWVLGWLLFVVLWAISYIVIWLKVPATSYEIALLILPIFMFWLLSSAYAEVNAESRKFFNSICPLYQDRLQLVRFIGLQPIQVGVFQVGLTYGTMISVFVAMSVALLSKIILDEIKT